MSELNDVPFAKAISSSCTNYDRLHYAIGPAVRVKVILVRKMAEALCFPMERGFQTLDGQVYNPLMMYKHSLRTLTEEEAMAISVLRETYHNIGDVQREFGLRLARCFNSAESDDEAAYVVNGLYLETQDDTGWEVRPTFKDYVQNQDLKTYANELATHLMLQGGAL